MPRDYNVDDILAEVSRKKAASGNPAPRKTTPAAPTPSPARGPKEAAPFQLAGMTEEFGTQPEQEEEQDTATKQTQGRRKKADKASRKAPPSPASTSTRKKARPAEQRAFVQMEEEEQEEQEEQEQRAVPRSTHRPAASEEPRSEHTRMSIPIPTGTRKEAREDIGATRIIPAITSSGDDLQLRRKEKIQQFMQSSTLDEDEYDYDADDNEDAEDTDEEEQEGGGFSQFFGGLTRSDSELKKNKKARALNQTAPPRQKQQEHAPKSKQGAEDEFEGEFRIPRDAVAVSDDIAAIEKTLTVRLAVNGVCFVLLLYLALCNLFALPLLTMICPESNMRLYLLVNLFVLLLSTLFSNTVLGSGLVSLFTLKADHDTPAAMAVLAVIAHGVSQVVSPESVRIGDANMYFVVAGLTLLMNTVGKRSMIHRIRQNFEVASCGASFAGAYMLTEDRLAQQLAEGQGLDEPAIAYSRRVDFPRDFIRLSYTDDYAESISRIISPMFLLFGVALALVSKFLFDQSGMQAMSIFTAVICIASPLTNTLVGSLPLYKATKVLAPKKAFISGYDAVELFEDVNAAALDVSELYPAQKAVLHGIKSFAQGRVDEAIVEAASVMSASSGLLKEVFMEVIGHKASMLRPVSQLRYHDGGIAARVGGRQIFIGSRLLMEQQGIHCPSRDYEVKFVKSGKSVLYLADEEEVCAMFVVGYTPSEEVADCLKTLAARQLSLLVRSNDPNITAQRIADDFDYPIEFIRIVPDALYEAYDHLIQPQESGEAYAMSAGALPQLRLLTVLMRLKRSIVTGTVLQLAGLILGYAITALLAFTGSIDKMGFIQLMIYQLFWALAVCLIPNLKGY